MDLEESVNQALRRVSDYLDARDLDGQCDQEHIHAYHNQKVSEEPCVLRRSDVKLLAEAAWMYTELLH